MAKIVLRTLIDITTRKTIPDYLIEPSTGHVFSCKKRGPKTGVDGGMFVNPDGTYQYHQMVPNEEGTIHISWKDYDSYNDHRQSRGLTAVQLVDATGRDTIEVEERQLTRMNAAPIFRTNGTRRMKNDISNQPADEHFDYIHQHMNISELMKKFGRDVLIEARKKLTVGEFMTKFA